MKDLVSLFMTEGQVTEVTPLGNGLINDTYLVRTAGETPDYVLQRINNNVFRNVDVLQHNIEEVTRHIRRKLEERGEADIDRKVLRFIPAKGTGKTYIEKDGSYWRLSRFIENAVTLDEVTPASAESAGRAFGEFQAMLADYPGQLEETIPDFHKMSFRLQQLDDAVKADAKGRVAGVKDILAVIDRHREAMCQPEKRYAEGVLPKRLCHCDTKVNNMMFDKDGGVLCVIDLDTVMPSFVYSDFGDFLRTSACTTPEDEPDLDKIDFRMDIFQAFGRGYIEGTASFMTPAERVWLADSAALFPYMQAVRFLTDWLNGDTYYKIKYPEHNLVRTRAQMRLLERVEARLPEMRRYIADL